MLNKVEDSTNRLMSVEVATAVDAEEIQDQAVIVVVEMVAEDAVATTVEEKETKIISGILKIGKRCYSLNERNSERCKKAALREWLLEVIPLRLVSLV